MIYHLDEHILGVCTSQTWNRMKYFHLFSSFMLILTSLGTCF